MFSFRNFYKPAPAAVQRWCAALQAVGGLIASSALAAESKRFGVFGLVLSAVGVGLEKLSAAPAPAAGPDPTTDSTMRVQDAPPLPPTVS